MTGALYLRRLPGLTLRERCLLLEICGHDCTELSPARVGELLGHPARTRWDAPALLDETYRELEWLSSHQGGVMALTETCYPELLREIYDPPFALCYRGAPPDPKAPFVAVVGTRRPNGRGARSAYMLGEELGRAGIPVVSGLARGIDRQAHEGNAAAGAPTVAVLGSGLNEAGPVSSRPAAELLLAAGGALLSEYPVFEPPRRFYFPQRNRIISGMSRSTVIVQAPLKSGALITADYALEQGRDVLVHRDCLQPGVGEGGLSLVESGARSVVSAADVMQDWGAQWPGPWERVS
jgi:DNA processing protein